MSDEKNKSGLNSAEAFDVVKRIQYAEGSVVSRTLVDSKAGTLTLFAFDAGQNLSEHTAPFDAIIQILEGEAVIIIDSKEHKLIKNEMILMPANIPHAVQANEQFKMLLTMFWADKK